MMEGGPSHIDTFDPKPKLAELHLKEFTRTDKMQSAMSGGKRYYVAVPVQVPQGRASAGRTWPTNWEHLAGVADDLCFYRGCQVDSVNHPTAMYQMNTGNRFGGDPAVGAWVTYGLGQREPEPAGLRRAAGGELPAGRGGQLGQRLPARPTSRARRCGRRARRSSTSTPPAGVTPRPPAGEPRPARRAEQAARRRPAPAATTSPPGWRATNWRSACRPRCRACSTCRRKTRKTQAPLRHRRGADRRLRPPVPARPPAGAAGRAVRAALRRHLGQPRLHREGPRQPGPAGRSSRSPG